ncbi:DUF2795 domain-containing protein [Aquipuribacter nitratireducens]|uniref:DUF2795 domain-containing protein n=1 Tax=Aquipuribacter nitratireducens TaxID=650104 RepID=A0ABW0GJH2_9MICO
MTSAPEPDRTDVDTRSEVAQALGKEVWPADRDTLRQLAVDNAASDRVLRILDSLPAGRTFDNVQEVAVVAGIASAHPEGPGAD